MLPKKYPQTQMLAICTSTLYPRWYEGATLKDERIVEKVRGNLALALVQKAKEHLFKIVIVDGGSARQFINQLKRLDVFLLDDTGGTMSSSRRKGYTHASKLPGVRVIAWSEPEKAPLMNSSLFKAAEHIINGKCDIVIPHRSPAAFDSLPPTQSLTEQEGNKQIQRILENSLKRPIPNYDIFFGPKLFANRWEIRDLFLTRYDQLLEVPPAQGQLMEKWSNSLTFPVIAAILKEYRVKSVDVDYIHPKEQTKLEIANEAFDRKRIDQVTEQVSSVALLAQYMTNF